MYRSTVNSFIFKKVSNCYSIFSPKMKEFQINLLLQKCSNQAILFLAFTFGLIQFVQCYKNWNYQHNNEQSQSRKVSEDNGVNHHYTNQYHYYNDHGLSLNTIGIGPASDDVGNISSNSRDFSLLKDKNKAKKPGLNNIIAYHRSLHNTSWAVTIPLFTFLLPIANSGDPVTLGNQALYGFFAALIIIIGYGVPILYNGQVPRGRSLENNKLTLKHLMHPTAGHLMNLGGISFQNQLGVDPMQCLQKTVCQSYRAPQNERYGILVKLIQYIFPARKDYDGPFTSMYEIAAKEGKFTKADCNEKYQCIFDVLDLASYLLSVYKRSRERAKEIEQERQ